MENFLTTLTSYLKYAGLGEVKWTVPYASAYRGTLHVNGVDVSVTSEGHYKSIFRKRFFNYKHGGYKWVEIVRWVVTQLPQQIDHLRKMKTEEELRKMAQELDKTISSDGLRCNYDTYNKKFELELRTEDFFLIQLAADRVRELDTTGMERSAPLATSGPPRFRLENVDGDPTGDLLSIYDLVNIYGTAERGAITEAVMDDLATCKLNCRVQVEDFWYTRVS